MRLHTLFLTLTLCLIGYSCTKSVKNATLTTPLDTDAWEQSQWISVKNAPVITCPIHDGTRVADGSSWFVTNIKNSKK